MLPELTSEYFESVGITVAQPRDGHRYGEESVELANFCRTIDCHSEPFAVILSEAKNPVECSAQGKLREESGFERSKERDSSVALLPQNDKNLGDVVEFGSGCGVISLILAARDHPRSVVAIEIQKTLHKIALKNVEQNNLSQIVTCVNADFRTYMRENPSSADVVISNPPFYAQNSGRMSKNSLRANARHEMHGTIDDLMASARLLLRPKGKLFLVFLKSRRTELLKIAKKNYFKISRMSEMNAKPYFLVEFFC